MFEKEELEVIKEDVLGPLESCYIGNFPETENLTNADVVKFDLEPREVVIRQVILKKIAKVLEE